MTSGKQLVNQKPLLRFCRNFYLSYFIT